MAHIKKLSDVVSWRLCLGCGACAYICPEQKVRLVDFFAEGIRPVVAADECQECRQCLDVCPAVQSDYRQAPAKGSNFTDAFTREWGPVVALWEGHATDPEIRFKGSSGGALTAISAYCLEVLGMHGVLQIGQDPDDPVRNRTGSVGRGRNYWLRPDRATRRRRYVMASAWSRPRQHPAWSLASRPKLRPYGMRVQCARS